VADKPDLSATLPLPTPLRRTAIVSFIRGEQPFHIVCVACSLRWEPDPDTGGEPIDWLHVHGYQGGPHAKVKFASKRFLLRSDTPRGSGRRPRLKVTGERVAASRLALHPPASG
jgi:hypothetical protein